MYGLTGTVALSLQEDHAKSSFAGGQLEKHAIGRQH